MSEPTGLDISSAESEAGKKYNTIHAAKTIRESLYNGRILKVFTVSVSNFFLLEDKIILMTHAGIDDNGQVILFRDLKRK